LAGLGAGWAWASAVLPVLRARAQLDAEAGATEIRNAATRIAADSGASGVGANVRGPCSRRCLLGDQLVQLSVAGLVVAVAAPPLAVTPVRAGIEKKVFSHADGAAAVMLATTSPLPPGYMTLAAAGVATAEMVRLDTVADWASPLEPPASPTAQFVAA